MPRGPWRGTPHLASTVAAELGGLAIRIAYAQWADEANDDDFGDLAHRALAELQAAATGC